jgi:hypothetical protein
MVRGNVFIYNCTFKELRLYLLEDDYNEEVTAIIITVQRELAEPREIPSFFS